jgi:hypothetical protein
MNNIIIKISNRGSIKKFTFQYSKDDSIEYLYRTFYSNLTKHYPYMRQNDSVVFLSYEDEDDDIITIQNENDLSECFSNTLLIKKNVIYFKIELKSCSILKEPLKNPNI